MNSSEAIDALSDGIDYLDKLISESPLLDTGQAVMLGEARKRLDQVQRELIEEAHMRWFLVTARTTDEELGFDDDDEDDDNEIDTDD